MKETTPLAPSTAEAAAATERLAGDFQMPCDLVASYTCIRLKPSSGDPGAEAATHGSGCLFGTVMTQTLLAPRSGVQPRR
jgi:hypothetical protein